MVAKAAKAAKPAKKAVANVARFADMLSAMGTEPRLRIMQLLLKSHPQGLVVGDIQEELGITGSTLSHHLEKLRHEGRHFPVWLAQVWKYFE